MIFRLMWKRFSLMDDLVRAQRHFRSPVGCLSQESFGYSFICLSVHLPVNQSIKHPVNHSINQSTNLSIILSSSVTISIHKYVGKNLVTVTMLFKSISIQRSSRYTSLQRNRRIFYFQSYFIPIASLVILIASVNLNSKRSNFGVDPRLISFRSIRVHLIASKFCQLCQSLLHLTSNFLRC